MGKNTKGFPLPSAPTNLSEIEILSNFSFVLLLRCSEDHLHACSAAAEAEAKTSFFNILNGRVCQKRNQNVSPFYQWSVEDDGQITCAFAWSRSSQHAGHFSDFYVKWRNVSMSTFSLFFPFERIQSPFEAWRKMIQKKKVSIDILNSDCCLTHLFSYWVRFFCNKVFLCHWVTLSNCLCSILSVRRRV